MVPESAEQARLFELNHLSASDHPGGIESIAEAFRKLYYYLYTNSAASRAERIVSDLSLLLLLKLALENHASEQSRDEIDLSADSLLRTLREYYPGLVDVHDRFSMGDQALRDCLDILRPVSLSSSPAHVLGDAFQALIGPRLRGDKGQFFTPRSLVRAMVRVVAPRPEESVLDPACGTGGFLIEAHVFQVAQVSTGAPTGLLTGADKDHDLFRIAAALLRTVCGERAGLRHCNSLDALLPLGAVEDGSYDVILTNPPFGSKIGVKDKSILRRYALAHQWVQRGGSTGDWHRTSIASTSQDPQILFLELCVRKLQPGGRLGIVLPEGLFGNRRSSYIWDWIRSQGTITALLDCPRTTFQPGTDTKTNVLFFRKHSAATSPTARRTERVYVAVSLHCGHDRRGRTHNSDGREYPDDFASLEAPVACQGNGSQWRNVKITEKSYLVPRYYVRATRSSDEESLVQGAEFLALGALRAKGYLTIRKGHECGSDAYGTGDIPFVRTSDITNFEISVDPTKAVSEEVYEEYARQQNLRPGDVLMVVDGRYRIGTTALLTENNCRCVVQSHFRILSLGLAAPIDSYALMFALNLPSVKMRIRNLVFVQSTLGTLGNRLLELEIPLLCEGGPWDERVHLFKEALRSRDGALSRLRMMTAPDCEL